MTTRHNFNFKPGLLQVAAGKLPSRYLSQSHRTERPISRLRGFLLWQNSFWKLVNIGVHDTNITMTAVASRMGVIYGWKTKKKDGKKAFVYFWLVFGKSWQNTQLKWWFSNFSWDEVKVTLVVSQYTLVDVVANRKRVMIYKVKVLSHSTAVHFFSLVSQLSVCRKNSICLT